MASTQSIVSPMSIASKSIASAMSAPSIASSTTIKKSEKPPKSKAEIATKSTTETPSSLAIKSTTETPSSLAIKSTTETPSSSATKSTTGTPSSLATKSTTGTPSSSTSKITTETSNLSAIKSTAGTLAAASATNSAITAASAEPTEIEDMPSTTSLINISPAGSLIISPMDSVLSSTKQSEISLDSPSVAHELQSEMDSKIIEKTSVTFGSSLSVISDIEITSKSNVASKLSEIQASVLEAPSTTAAAGTATSQVASNTGIDSNLSATGPRSEPRSQVRSTASKTDKSNAAKNTMSRKGSKSTTSDVSNTGASKASTTSNMPSNASTVSKQSKQSKLSSQSAQSSQSSQSSQSAQSSAGSSTSRAQLSRDSDTLKLSTNMHGKTSLPSDGPSATSKTVETESAAITDPPFDSEEETVPVTTDRAFAVARARRLSQLSARRVSAAARSQTKAPKSKKQYLKLPKTGKAAKGGKKGEEVDQSLMVMTGTSDTKTSFKEIAVPESTAVAPKKQSTIHKLLSAARLVQNRRTESVASFGSKLSHAEDSLEAPSDVTSPEGLNVNLKRITGKKKEPKKSTAGKGKSKKEESKKE